MRRKMGSCICIMLHIYPPITRKRPMCYMSSLKSCQPYVYQERKIPLNAFPNGTMSKLAGFFYALPFNAESQAGNL